jgi:type II secretory pathway component PulK
MKHCTKVLVVLMVVALVAGCATHIHQVGRGAQSGQMEQQRQWYVLFGLVPINNVDTGDMAGEADDYTIKTQQSFLDVVINIFTGIVSVNSRTVTVTK